MKSPVFWKVQQFGKECYLGGFDIVMPQGLHRSRYDENMEKQSRSRENTFFGTAFCSSAIMSKIRFGG